MILGILIGLCFAFILCLPFLLMKKFILPTIKKIDGGQEKAE